MEAASFMTPSRAVGLHRTGNKFPGEITSRTLEGSDTFENCNY